MSPSTTNTTLFCIFFTLNDRTSHRAELFFHNVFSHALRGEVSLTFRPNPADPFPSQTRRRRRISKISEARDEQDVSTHARARDGVVVPPRPNPRAPSRRTRRRRRPRRAQGPAAPTAVAVVRQVLPSVPGRRDRRDRGSPPQPPPASPPRGRDGPDGGAPAAAVARGARVWVGGFAWFVWRGRVGGDSLGG